MLISEHIRLKEIECRCTDVKCTHTLIHPLVLFSFERLRKECNDTPLMINSGFRCQLHNIACGGVEKSKHCMGLAIDIQVPANISGQEFKELAEKAGFDYVKYYPGQGFCHCHINID